MIDLKLIQKAILLTQTGKIEEAREIYEGLLKDNPDSADLLSIVGLFYVNIGDFDMAFAKFD